MTRTKKQSSGDLCRDAFVQILRVRERFYAELTALLKKYGLTEPQYNVLRILRGAGPDGLPCLEVGRHMITRVPDVTRLLDRLEADGLVWRERSTDDRRVVLAHITDTGLKLLLKLKRPVEKVHHAQFKGLTGSKLAEVVKLTGRLRNL